MTSLVDYVTSWWSVEWRGCIHHKRFPLLAIDKTGPGPDHASSRCRAFFVDCWAFESYFESKQSMLHYAQQSLKYMYTLSIELLPVMYAVNKAVKFFAAISTDLYAVCSLAFGFKRQKHALDLASMYIF